jgi:hypothetical protein
MIPSRCNAGCENSFKRRCVAMRPSLERAKENENSILTFGKERCKLNQETVFIVIIKYKVTRF